MCILLDIKKKLALTSWEILSYLADIPGICTILASNSLHTSRIIFSAFYSTGGYANFRRAWYGPRIRAINPLSVEISFGKTITKFEETTKVGPWEAGHMRYNRPDGYCCFDKPLKFSVEAGLTEIHFVLT